MSIRTFINLDSTVLVKLLTVDEHTLVHVSVRDEPDAIWSPPIVLREERS